ncbi:hypothetical protein P4631_19405 [Halalkalibacterium halodurans]|uniref:hypothetical protein n=1 Tax=Halalkalibacterium halodurans TaxID=86665 RepID=UPI002E23CDCC|nr:hypothetical protein [Halalkalibacterium halodurans]
MMKKTAVERAFIGLMEERIHQVAREKAMNDPEYTSADEKKSSLFECLRDSLTTEKQRSLLDDLEGAWTYTGGLMQEFAYRQGIKDSPMIHNELQKFGISVKSEGEKNQE